MTTIDHPEIDMDRQKAWRTGASLILVAIGIFSFSALLHYHVVHEGRSTAGSPLLAPALGLSTALGFAAALSFSLLLTLWASIAFVTDHWAASLRRIWMSLVFALCLSVFVHGLDYDGGTLGGPIANRMAYVLGDSFSTFLLGILSFLAFLLATNWLFFENFLALARGCETGGEPGLADLEEQLLQAQDENERNEILRSFQSANLTKPASPAAWRQDVLEAEALEKGALENEALESKVAAERPSAVVEPEKSPVRAADDERAADPVDESPPQRVVSSSLRVQARVGRAMPVQGAEESLSRVSPQLRAGSPLSAEELESTRNRRNRIRSARLRRDQEVLEEILEEVRSSIGPEIQEKDERAGGDPMADLDDDLLLEKAGQALDDLLGEGGGSLELNLPDTGSTESEGPTGEGRMEGQAGAQGGSVGQRRFEEPRPVEDSGSPEPKADPRAEPWVQTPMGRIPVVDRGLTTAQDAASGSTAEPAMEPTAGSPEDSEAADPVESAPAGETIASPEEPPAETDEPVAEAREPLAEAEQPVGATEDPAAATEEPVFILEPQPTVRIYGGDEAEESEYEQQELFAEEPPDPELLDRAARVLLTSRRPTVSLLQRRIGLSYAEARQVMNYMQKLGALAAPAGRGPWQALVSLGEWDERRA